MDCYIMAIDVVAEHIGKLGYGNMRLPKTADGKIDIETINSMIDMFLDAGFTYFDTAYIYQGSEDVLGECLVKRHPRESFRIATKLALMNVTSAHQMPIQIETSMKRLGVDYVDFYLLHGLSTDTIAKANKFDAWGYLRNLKAEGKARHIGFSFHGTPEELEELLANHPEIEFVQLQINYLDWENPKVQSHKLYDIARKYGKLVSIMEPNKGGWLASEESETGKMLKAANPDTSVASWAFRYLLGLDGLMVVLSGMGNTKEVADNIHTFKNYEPLTAEEHALLQKVVEIINSAPTVPCTRCNYCAPNCPKKIAIPSFINLLNNYLVHKNIDTIKHVHFMMTGEGASGPADCIRCGACERSCPQHLHISELMAQVTEIVHGGQKE